MIGQEFFKLCPDWLIFVNKFKLQPQGGSGGRDNELRGIIYLFVIVSISKEEILVFARSR